jgi:hypothetical protein
MARKKSQVQPASAAVSWRSGVHLVGTSIWCDAARRRDVGFVSSGDQKIGSDYAQLIATPETLAVIGAAPGGALSVPISQPFSIGQTRLELFATGVGFGSAGLRVERSGRIIVFAGAVNAQSTTINQAATPVRCDTLVVDAPLYDHGPYAQGHYVDELQGWMRNHGSEGNIAVVLVDGLCRAIDVMLLLQTEPDLGVSAHPSIVAAAQRCRSVSPQLRVPQKAHAKSRGVIIWLVKARSSVRSLLKKQPFKSVWASALGLDPDISSAVAADEIIPWANAAEMVGLRRWVETTGATEVLVTGRFNVAMANAIGAHARPLGPPQQMMLFSKH